MNSLILVALCTSSVYVHAQTHKTSTIANVSSSVFFSGRLKSCSTGKSRSPIHIAKKDLNHKGNNIALSFQSFENFDGKGVNFSINNTFIVGQPNYDMYIIGDQVTRSIDLYAIQLFPKKLHTVQGMPTPSIELHAYFIEDLPDRVARGEADQQDLLDAARANKLMVVAQLVAPLPAGQVRDKDLLDYFLDCLLGLAGGNKSVLCVVSLPKMVPMYAGAYLYTGSLMYPVCQEYAHYLVVRQTLFVSAERIGKIQAMLPNFTARAQQPVFGGVEMTSLANAVTSSALWTAVVGCLLGARVFDVFHVFCH